MKKRLVFLSLITISLYAGSFTYSTTAQLVGVNGNYVTNPNYDYGSFTGPYFENVGGQVIPVWCIDPNILTAIGTSYQATVVVGTSTPEILLLDAIIAETGSSTDPIYQQALWAVVDPSQWPVTAKIQDIINLALNETVYSDQFELIEGVGQQTYDAAIPVSSTPEPATWGMLGIGGLFIWMGKRNGNRTKFSSIN